MASRTDEVQASVDTEIDLVISSRLLLLQHVGLVLVVEELDDGHPGIFVVDIVTESRGVDNGQTNCKSSQLFALVSIILYIQNPPLKNFSSSSAFVISISTVLSTCF